MFSWEGWKGEHWSNQYEFSRERNGQTLAIFIRFFICGIKFSPEMKITSKCLSCVGLTVFLISGKVPGPIIKTSGLSLNMYSASTLQTYRKTYEETHWGKGANTKESVKIKDRRFKMLLPLISMGNARTLANKWANEWLCSLLHCMQTWLGPLTWDGFIPYFVLPWSFLDPTYYLGVNKAAHPLTTHKICSSEQFSACYLTA